MANARFSIAPAYYTGSEVTPEVTVTHSGKTLVKDRDFTVTYHNNIEPSSYYNSPWVGIDGIGNYQGYVTKSFTINRADISSCTVTLSDESLTYTGSSLRPTATVKSGEQGINPEPGLLRFLQKQLGCRYCFRNPHWNWKLHWFCYERLYH